MLQLRGLTSKQTILIGDTICPDLDRALLRSSFFKNGGAFDMVIPLCVCVCYLIGVRPECRNGELSFHPAFSDSIRGVPHCVTLSTSIYLQAESENTE